MKTLLMAALLTAAPVPTVRATTFAALTLAQQAKKADVIVQATIGTPTTVTEGTNSYAVYPLKVSETLAGDAALLPQTVGSQGGSGPALFVLNGVDSAPVFQAGQEAVLLLYKGRLDSPLVGYNQGAYLITNGQVSVLVPPLAVGAAGAGQTGVTPSGTPAAPTTPAASQTAAASVPIAGPTPTAAGTAAPGSAANMGSVGTTPPVPVPPTVPPVAVPAPVQIPATASTSPVTAPTETPAATGTTGNPGSPAPTASAAPVPGGSGTPEISAAPPAPVPVTLSVLGSIRTPAELKAAIVAARAAK